MRVPGWGLLLVFLLGVALGWQTHTWKTDAELTAAGNQRLSATLQVEHAEAQASASAGQANAARLQQQGEKAHVITREVIRYVKSPDAGHCPLPAEWVRLHDEAAGLSRPAGTASAPADSAGAAAAPASDADALTVVTDNYATCAREIERLRGWQEWYRSVSRAAR